MTGILADSVAVDCMDCGTVLLMPLRMVTEAPGPRCYGCQARADEDARAKEERKRMARVTGERKRP